MKFYAAILPTADVLRAVGTYPRVLLSFAHNPDKALSVLHPAEVMIDSGAFTVWTTGASIDLDAYGRWCADLLARERAFDVSFINLDVIPGGPDRAATPEDRERAMAASMVNADRLRDVYGIPIMEVFHFGEPVAFLHELLARRRPGESLGFGGIAAMEHRARGKWLDAAWGEAMAWARSATVVPRLHGLGCSNEDFARRYPWWSVDSSTHAIPFRFGRTLNGKGRQEFITRPGGESLRRALPAQRIEAVRILDRWKRLERDMTAAWDRRGIEFAP